LDTIFFSRLASGWVVELKMKVSCWQSQRLPKTTVNPQWVGCEVNRCYQIRLLDGSQHWTRRLNPFHHAKTTFLNKFIFILHFFLFWCYWLVYFFFLETITIGCVNFID
jgi:hypothetical protein